MNKSTFVLQGWLLRGLALQHFSQSQMIGAKEGVQGEHRSLKRLLTMSERVLLGRISVATSGQLPGLQMPQPLPLPERGGSPPQSGSCGTGLQPVLTCISCPR